VVACATPLHQPLRPEHSQALRNRGEFLAERCHDFRDAPFAARQQLQELQPGRIAERFA
jgi:hypothetical protein